MASYLGVAQLVVSSTGGEFYIQTGSTARVCASILNTSTRVHIVAYLIECVRVIKIRGGCRDTRIEMHTTETAFDCGGKNYYFPWNAFLSSVVYNIKMYPPLELLPRRDETWFSFEYLLASYMSFITFFASYSLF